MSTRTHPRELWNELMDRDLDIIIEGGEPRNADLVPLESFVTSLSSFSTVSLSEQFIREHAADAADAAREAAAGASSQIPVSPRVRLVNGLRRKLAAAATSMAMIVGVTGVAWASDDAVPGDWNYGIDRALEAIGIGAGGAEERLAELEALGSQNLAAGLAEDSAGSPNRGEPNSGLENAASRVDPASGAEADVKGGTNALEVRSAVAELLRYLAENDSPDPGAVSELVHKLRLSITGPDSNRPDDAGKPDDVGKPDDPGKPEDPGQPDDPGKPEDPGQPEDPGKPADPGQPAAAGKPAGEGGV